MNCPWSRDQLILYFSPLSKVKWCCLLLTVAENFELHEPFSCMGGGEEGNRMNAILINGGGGMPKVVTWAYRIISLENLGDGKNNFERGLSYYFLFFSEGAKCLEHDWWGRKLDACFYHYRKERISRKCSIDISSFYLIDLYVCGES